MAKSVSRFFFLIALTAFASGFNLYDVSLGSQSFSDSVREYDVIPPSWITADGKFDGVFMVGDDRVAAFVFPSLPLEKETSQPLHADVPDLFRPGSRFRDSVFVQPAASEFGQAIEIRSAEAATGLKIDIDGASMTQIRRLGWRRFQALQAAYVGWLYNETSCWPTNCFSDAFAHNLSAFWKNRVLSDAGFARFASNYLNLGDPQPIRYKDSRAMFATPILPQQELSITWGNQNFYPELSTKGGSSTTTLTNSYSRTISGGSTRLQVILDRGMRLYPRRSCKVEGAAGSDGVLPYTLAPYPDSFKIMFGNWFIPIYNFFDLHNPLLLTAENDSNMSKLSCSDGTSSSPKYLFLLAPSVYVKPDTVDQISQFETEGRRGASEDPRDAYLLLTRQFVILACDKSNIEAVRDEWRRMLDTAAGIARKHGSCGHFRHGVFSGKAFVELRNHFSIDGRLLEDGVLDQTTIGQATGASLGTRINVEGAPGSPPLLDLWRVSPGDEGTRLAGRIHIRFYTTMSAVLDQATVVEGDDVHVIPVSEILR